MKGNHYFKTEKVSAGDGCAVSLLARGTCMTSVVSGFSGRLITPLRILLANLMHLHYLHYLILLTIAASAATSFATHLHVSF